ncbi:hypothetical protein MMC15_002950 [Xylographa vitiligo]|nr:hypothetical protein [Xylographa vitiligo]
MEEVEHPIVKIDPKGDVILELTSPQGKSRLLVSLKVLSLVSSVFDTMFNSLSKEILHNQPARRVFILLLPEDGAEALTTLYGVLHYRPDEFDEDIHPDCLVNVAMVADKFDCVAAIMLPSKI